MKKLHLFLSLNLLACSLASLAGCSTPEKIDLAYGDTTVSEVTTISFDLLKEKIDSKDTFLLVVQYSDGCGCWVNEAKPTIEKYIQEKHVVCYHIKKADLDAGGNRFGITIVTGNVSFAIFEDGEVKHCITTQDDETLKKYDQFTSYVESIVNLPRMYYVSLDDVDRMYKTAEKNIIYYSRSTCGDCSYVNTHFLKDWSKKNPGFAKKIYILDCDQQDIRLDDEGKVNAEQWQTFKDDYGMSNKFNTVYGYDTGYVPSFFLIEGSLTGVKYLSGAVAFNDSTKKDGDEFVVTNSYYTEERKQHLQYIDDEVEYSVLKGITLTADDMDYYEKFDFYAWKHESAEKYHNPLLEKFLSYCEKQ